MDKRIIGNWSKNWKAVSVIVVNLFGCKCNEKNTLKKQNKMNTQSKSFNISSSKNKKDLGKEKMNPEIKQLFEYHAKENNWADKKKNSNIKLDKK